MYQPGSLEKYFESFLLSKAFPGTIKYKSSFNNGTVTVWNVEKLAEGDPAMCTCSAQPTCFIYDNTGEQNLLAERSHWLTPRT